jgi:hypothetical protein
VRKLEIANNQGGLTGSLGEGRAEFVEEVIVGIP